MTIHKKTPKGILIFYKEDNVQDASNVQEHLDAFIKLSQFDIDAINTFSQPWVISDLEKYDFVIFHYTLFSENYYSLSIPQRKQLKNYWGLKIAFFQDEMHHVQRRLSFIRDLSIEIIFTHLSKEDQSKVYGQLSCVKKILFNLPGYIQETNINNNYIDIPHHQRLTDVCYRGRQLYFYLGRSAQEKTYIADEFTRRLKQTKYHLQTDIQTNETSRIYGEKWLDFIGRSRCVLGCESGIDLFDLQDNSLKESHHIFSQYPGISFEEYLSLSPQRESLESNIHYRCLGPRHFEAICLKTCQILFKGSYSAILIPYRHYIPLEKDFSNFDEVISLAIDKQQTQKIADQAYNEIVLQGNFKYTDFIKFFDLEISEVFKSSPSGNNQTKNHVQTKTETNFKADSLFSSVKEKSAFYFGNGYSLWNGLTEFKNKSINAVAACTSGALIHLLENKIRPVFIVHTTDHPRSNFYLGESWKYENELSNIPLIASASSIKTISTTYPGPILTLEDYIQPKTYNPHLLGLELLAYFQAQTIISYGCEGIDCQNWTTVKNSTPLSYKIYGEDKAVLVSPLMRDYLEQLNNLPMKYPEQDFINRSSAGVTLNNWRI